MVANHCVGWEQHGGLVRIKCLCWEKCLSPFEHWLKSSLVRTQDILLYFTGWTTDNHQPIRKMPQKHVQEYLLPGFQGKSACHQTRVLPSASYSKPVQTGSYFRLSCCQFRFFISIFTNISNQLCVAWMTTTCMKWVVFLYEQFQWKCECTLDRVTMPSTRPSPQTPCEASFWKKQLVGRAA